MIKLVKPRYSSTITSPKMRLPLICHSRQCISEITAFTFMVLVFTGCETLFQYSPYDSKVSASSLNRQNIALLQEHDRPDDTLNIVLLSDNHNYYSALRQTVACINNLPNVNFVFTTGDITETGLAQEYELFLTEIRKLNRPFMTAIGNHDYRSNGGVIFRKMFGAENFYFDYRNYRFIFFANTIWERGNQAPDFEWLESAMYSADTTRKLIIITHIQPGDDQWAGEYTTRYELLLEKYKVLLSIHGHIHNYCHYSKSGVDYLMTDWVADKNFVILKLSGRTFQLQRVWI